jgi:hypothetical protein
MTNAEQEFLLRTVFESVIHDTMHDAETIRRRVMAYACSLDCPSTKVAPRILAEKLRISRQAFHKRVDKSTVELAEIKANCRIFPKPGCTSLAIKTEAVKFEGS